MFGLRMSSRTPSCLPRITRTGRQSVAQTSPSSGGAFAAQHRGNYGGNAGGSNGGVGRVFWATVREGYRCYSVNLFRPSLASATQSSRMRLERNGSWVLKNSNKMTTECCLFHFGNNNNNNNNNGTKTFLRNLSGSANRSNNGNARRNMNRNNNNNNNYNNRNGNRKQNNNNQNQNGRRMHSPTDRILSTEQTTTSRNTGANGNPQARQTQDRQDMQPPQHRNTPTSRTQNGRKDRQAPQRSNRTKRDNRTSMNRQFNPSTSPTAEKKPGATGGEDAGVDDLPDTDEIGSSKRRNKFLTNKNKSKKGTPVDLSQVEDAKEWEMRSKKNQNKAFKKKKGRGRKPVVHINQDMTVELPPALTLRELALKSNIKSVQIINKLIDLGGMGDEDSGIEMSRPLSNYMLTQLKIAAKTGRGRIVNQQISDTAAGILITADIAELLLDDFGMKHTREKPKVLDEFPTDPEKAVLECKNPEKLATRAPIITVMGHVDHGKTTLLDTLRNTSVAEGEAGGITQAVAAFTFGLGDRQITFLDTPGHEAFASMRKSGSSLTDIIILIVSATDGVRPQTVESIELAKAAGVPIIVALTKIDMPGVDLDITLQRVSDELALEEIMTEQNGGSVQMIPISAPEGIGLDKLEEAILLQAEFCELAVDTNSRGEAVVLESCLDRALGAAADSVVRWGTLKVGDFVVCGEQATKIRKMEDSDGKQLKKAPPSTPVRIYGFDSPPTPGSEILTVPNKKRAREVVGLRKRRREDAEQAALRREQSELSESEAETEVNEGDETDEDGAEGKAAARANVPLILKADTDGSLEALRYSVDGMVSELETDAEKEGIATPKIQVLRRGVGPVTLSDIELAKALNAQVFAFNVRVPNNVVRAAENANVHFATQNVIYHLLDDIRGLVDKNTPKEPEEVVLGRAKVLKIFEMNPRRRSEGTWIVAGCSVQSGLISKNARLRVKRDEEVIHNSGLDSLYHFKRAVDKIESGNECGISLSSFQDFQVGDIIEAFEFKK